MLNLDNLNMRLRYHGGVPQQQRMINDKLRSLKKALIYSYQAATLVRSDGAEFRCLMNPDKLKGDYDNKMLSIPYQSVQLNAPMAGKTSQGQIDVNLHPGDVFTWKQTDTKWLIYLHYLEEDAYFRADVRRCDSKTKIGDKEYWVYTRGPVQTSIVWNQKAQVEWNDLNFSLVMYITKDENTLATIHRFANLKISDEDGFTKTWRVVAENPYYGDGIIQVMLDEYFENSIQDAVNEQNAAIEAAKPKPEETAPQIIGPARMGCYDRANFKIKNASGGSWFIFENGYELPYNNSDDKITLETTSGKPGQFILIYRIPDGEEYRYRVQVEGF